MKYARCKLNCDLNFFVSHGGFDDVYAICLSGKHVSKGEALQKTMKIIIKLFPRITDAHTLEEVTAMRALEFEMSCLCVNINFKCSNVADWKILTKVAKYAQIFKEISTQKRF